MRLSRSGRYSWAMIDSMIQFFRAGGVVMYPLAVLSVIAIAAILERAFYWVRHSSIRELRALDRYSSLLSSSQHEAAANLAKKDPSPMGRMVSGALAHDSVSEEAVLVVLESIRPSFERFNALLGAIIGAAPLLGILGTVVGIIESFDLLGQAASVSDPTVIAGGIAQALYTTAAGLTVALVALFPAAYFRSRAATTLSRLESLGALIPVHR